jgi:4-hydroxyphenylpyruvate dioxygenase-like putative hemolysin
VAGNGNGIVAFDTANVTLGRSVITANGNGINNATAPNTFYSYQDNRINGNATDIIGTALNSHALQ